MRSTSISLWDLSRYFVMANGAEAPAQERTMNSHDADQKQNAPKE